MKRRFFIVKLFILFLILTSNVRADSSSFEQIRQIEDKGWYYLYELLVNRGVPKSIVSNVLLDDKFPEFTAIKYKVFPKEPRNIYSRLNTKKRRQSALKFFKKYKTTFLKAEEEFSVPASVILSILEVETACGKNTGNEKVIYRLARLSSVLEPENFKLNIEYNKKLFPDVTEKEIRDRGQWLQDTFMPHLIKAFTLARSLGLDPLELKGSSSGAIGLPQFLPGNVYQFGVSAKGASIANLYDPEDAIFSVANFLKQHGWDEFYPPQSKREEVISKYNKSQPYVDTVLAIAKRLSRYTY